MLEFEADRGAYYEGLLRVSRDDDWTGWCRFFLQAEQAQAEDNLARARGIIDPYDSLKRRVIDLSRSQYAICALDWIFERRSSAAPPLRSKPPFRHPPRDEF